MASEDVVPRKRIRLSDERVERTYQNGGARENMDATVVSDEEELDLSQQPDFLTQADKEPSSGIIEKVVLKNFLCHAHQVINFGQRVNFLIGKNGSGKSAILTALIVGLGGKALATSRGSSITNFVKHGEIQAKISITIYNGGDDSFKPEVYGDRIIVERSLKANGQHGAYILKSAKGKVISQRKEELVNMLNTLNIQVDNPVCILTQDASKTFLHSTNSRDKYKFFMRATQLETMRQDYARANILNLHPFFMRATQLETMRQDYARAQQYKEKTREIIDSKTADLRNREKEVKKLEEQVKAFEALEELQRRVHKLRHEMAWTIVSEKEKTFEPLRKEFDTETARTPKFQAKVDEMESKLTELTSRQKVITEQMGQISSDVAELEPKYRELKAAKDGKKKHYRSQLAEVERLDKEKALIERDRTKIEERIEDIKTKQMSDFEARKRASEERMVVLEEQLSNARDPLNTTEHFVSQFKAAAARAKKQIAAIRSEEQDLHRQKDKLSREIRDLQATKSSKLHRFGKSMPELARQIEAAHQQGAFHTKPLGPIGALLSVRDPKWAVGVEICLEDMLKAFVVNDHHDEKVLEGIIQRVWSGHKPITITQKFTNEIYDVSRFKATSPFPTVLDMLDLTNIPPSVVNCLIDQKGIENIILIPSTSEVTAYARSDPHRSVRAAFTKQGDQAFFHPPSCVTTQSSVQLLLLLGGIHESYYEFFFGCLGVHQSKAFTKEGDQAFFHPKLRYYSVAHERTSSVLTGNVEEAIKLLREREASIDVELKEKAGEIGKVDVDIRSNSEQERQYNTSANRLREQIARLEFEMQEVRSAVEERAPDVSALEDDVSRYTEQIAAITEKRESLTERLRTFQEEHEQAEQEFKDVDRLMRERSESSNTMQEERANLQGDLEIARKHKKHYVGKRKEHEKKVNDLEKEVKAAEDELKNCVTRAEAVCERVCTRRTPQSVQSEIKQIEQRIKTERETRGNREEIEQKFEESRAALHRIQKHISQCHENVRMLDRTIELRLQGFINMRQMQALRCKFFFITALSARQYQGKLIFDHEQETLILNVQPNREDLGANNSKDIRSLSGGERSFSTVCFILSLWDTIESPFRMMDEFDVYMDMINRKMAMTHLIQSTGTLRNKSSQFIFLTPQDMSLPPTKDVRILRLREPVRVGQSTMDDFMEGENSGQE